MDQKFELAVEAAEKKLTSCEGARLDLAAVMAAQCARCHLDVAALTEFYEDVVNRIESYPGIYGEISAHEKLLLWKQWEPAVKAAQAVLPGRAQE